MVQIRTGDLIVVTETSTDVIPSPKGTVLAIIDTPEGNSYFSAVRIGDTGVVIDTSSPERKDGATIMLSNGNKVWLWSDRFKKL